MIEKVKRAAAAFKAKVGRRGSSLLFFALINLIGSYQMFTAGPDDRAALIGFTRIVPLVVWATAFGVTGLLGLVQAFTKRDREAFVGFEFMYLAWASGYVTSASMFGVEAVLMGIAIYVGLAGFVLMISGWPEERP